MNTPFCVATCRKKALNLVRQGIYLFVGQDANKIIYKNTLKARLYKDLKPFLKVRYVMLRHARKVCFVVLRRTRWVQF